MQKLVPKLPRIPRVLADELRLALGILDDLDRDLTMELLARFRRNRMRCIAAWGINSGPSPVQGLEPIPIERLADIERLDRAFRNLIAFKNGGAEDYVAVDVEKEINRARARQSRKRITPYQEIGMYLRRRGYAESANKKALVIDAMGHFQVSKSTVYRAIRDLGLVGK